MNNESELLAKMLYDTINAAKGGASLAWRLVSDAGREPYRLGVQVVIEEYKVRSRDTNPLHHTDNDGTIRTGRTVVNNHDGFRLTADGQDWEPVTKVEDGKS